MYRGASRYTKSQVLAAIDKSKGFRSVIAKRLGCSCVLAMKYVRKWSETNEAFLDECDKAIEETLKGNAII